MGQNKMSASNFVKAYNYNTSCLLKSYNENTKIYGNNQKLFTFRINGKVFFTATDFKPACWTRFVAQC